MPRRIYFGLAVVVALSVFCWQAATQGAKPKDEMLELYGLFVDAVEKVVERYLAIRESPDERFLETVRRVGLDPFKLAVYGEVTDADHS